MTTPNDASPESADQRQPRLPREPGQRLWNLILWLPLIAAALWLGARWSTPKVDPQVSTPAALAEQLPAKGFALVSLGAEWCGACRVLDGEIATFSSEQPALTVIKIDVDNERDIANHYKIRAIPVMLLFHNGQLVDHYAGVKRAAGLSAWLAQHQDPSTNATTGEGG